MESYHALRLADLLTSVVYMLRVFSMVQSLLVRFHLEFQVNLPVVPEP
jgi:hypothetical protein